MRSLLQTAALVACALVPACNKPTVAPPAGTPSALTRPNFDRIQVGMTLPEVEALLGPPLATVGEDVRQPDGGTRKQVNAATWGLFKVHVPAGGAPQVLEERWIGVDLADGKVTAKREKGLE